MNTDLLLRVADRIERDPDLFRMDTYFCPSDCCGTSACIAGHAIMEHKGITGLPELIDTSTTAALLLGIGYLGRKRLFYPDSPFWGSTFDNFENEWPVDEVVAVLKVLAENPNLLMESTAAAILEGLEEEGRNGNGS